MSNKQRGEKIRQQILLEVQLHPADIAKHIATLFSITPQAVYSHLKQLETSGWLMSSGRGKGKKYFLGDVRKFDSVFQFINNLEEDSIWRTHFSFIFNDLPEDLVDICHYGFTEMVNNAIDHSGGTDVYISVSKDNDKIEITIVDNGEGIFKRIKRLCNLSDERQALFELSKGKLTTDPDNHTGEGIFFTSRAFDEFAIESNGVRFTHDDNFEFDIIDNSHSPINKIGTVVRMYIKSDSDRKIENVFDSFTAGPDEFEFNKTVIPVRLAQYDNEKLVSRSQAKRVLARIEKFQNVIFDFEEVSTVGQAFADEIFRVYSNKHPEIILLPINMENRVNKMVNKALIGANKNNT